MVMSTGKNAGPSEADLDLLPGMYVCVIHVYSVLSLSHCAGEVLVGRAPNTCLYSVLSLSHCAGEVLVGRAPNTCLLLFSADSIDTKQSEGVCGTLFITNHRLMFRPNPYATNKVSRGGFLVMLYVSLSGVVLFS